MQEFITPNEERFFGENDSVTIQNAVTAACEDGCRTLLIPRYNLKRDKAEWRIPVSIKIPSDFTVILDNCYMAQETGVYDNMFTNEHSRKPDYFTVEKEDKNITVKGIGNVVLSGGVHNHLLEKTTGKYGLTGMFFNNMFFWVNVNGLTVTGLQIEDHRYWAFNHIMCRNVFIKNIYFHVVPLAPTLDGIDMRIGCNNFKIENIYGRTGDDTVAMNALMGVGEKQRLVEGKDTDIHDIEIRNVKSDPIRYYSIRILNHDGNKIYNVNIDTVMDTSDFTDKAGGIPLATIGIGAKLYWTLKPAAHGDTHHINIKNVTSRARDAVYIGRTLKDSSISNVKTFGDNTTLVRFSNSTTENVTFGKCFYGRTQAELFSSRAFKPEDYTGVTVEGVNAEGEVLFKDFTVDKVNKVFALNGRLNVNIENFKCNYNNILAKKKDDKIFIDSKEII